jgi:hypothetical protein
MQRKMFVTFGDGKMFVHVRSDSRYAMLSVAVGDNN